jgi:hypothetical protein
MLAALALGTVFAAPANAASDEDFVVGTGAIEIPNPLFPESTLQVDISLDAHSDPSGGSPTGTVLATVPIAGLVVFSGSVTCLAVTGNRAVIGFEDMFSGHVIFDVVDNIATGTPDTIGLVQGGPAGCSLPERPEPDPLVSGNFVVHDADDTLIPDLIIKRRSDGTLFFDNVYTLNPSAYFHAITPGGFWTYAILVQNDGDSTDDMIVQAPPPGTAPFDVQYFYGYYDVTALVESDGVLLPDVEPGGTRQLAVRFHADPASPNGAQFDIFMRIVAPALGEGPVDTLRLRVVVT